MCRQKHHSTLCGAEFRKLSEPSTTPVAAQTVATEPVQLETTTAATTTTTTVTAAIVPPEPATTVPTNSICLLKTAVAQVDVNGVRVEANVLFDEGAQRSFISNQLAKKLQISPQNTESINISTFEGESPSTRHLGTASVNVETLTGELIPISVLLVPVIAAPLQNTYHAYLTNMEHLQGLHLANPVTKSSNFYISLLIGADYYWQFMGDHIVRGDGPTTMQSRGYLLSGPLVVPSAPSHNASMFQVSTTTADCNNTFWMMESADAM